MPGINTLETATLFQTVLDQAILQDMTTGWMDANAGQVIYNGGSEVKIPTINMDGMGDYDRDAGYLQGGVELKYQTHTMTQDRGRKFQLDAMDVNETNFVATASAVMGEFQRMKVVPEIDAYRLSKIASLAIAAAADEKDPIEGMIGYGYNPANGEALKTFKTAVANISEHYNGELVAHVSPGMMLALEMELSNKIAVETFSRNGIDTSVPKIDNVYLIKTPQDRMYTSIQILDGKTAGQKEGGYKKAESAKTINFEIMPTMAPIAVTKQDLMRIFDPSTNQSANAWAMDYRRFHDLWIKKNVLKTIAVSVKEAKE